MDLGLSKLAHREKFKKFAKSNNYELKIYFLDLSKEMRLERIIKGNKEKGVTYEFEVAKENFEFMERWFEKPTENEMIGGLLFTT